MVSQPRRIVLTNVGSRGDVQPYCLVGKALEARGHHVTIAAEKRVENIVVDEYKLPFRCIAGDFVGILFDPNYTERLYRARNFEFLRMTGEWTERFDVDRSELQASIVAALEGAEVVVSGYLIALYTYSICEANGATWIPLYLGNAALPTSEYPHWLVEDLTFGFSCLNKWGHSMITQKLWSDRRDEVNRWRQETLQLPPITSKFGIVDSMLANESIAILDACSLVLSGPHQRVPLDYPPGKLNSVGFIFPPEDEPGSDALQAFLKASDLPVIYIGFGSMPVLEPLALVQLAIQVCQNAKCRCVIATGSTVNKLAECAALASTYADTIFLETNVVSHMWLFPRMSCLLHHCGMGTTGVALRSGTPQIPCPKFIDQPHNAKVLVQLGVALQSLSGDKMTVQNVTRAVQQVLANERNVQGRAKEVGAIVANESDKNLERISDLILAAPPTFA
ncbi:unnamed protein product [Aphanomyces euteiches]|uniref:Uncharacterized protein n=1 Tax=Aphanomyces euteiches TaxID=100861 RepID=A0A6G0WA56_9STRA|nr:hypothetical protein Ae201684_017665 [Aphanomyces euteiches]KAH9100700.1 hypothetical protein Ae201684P_006894 [Aphanomyces euteiches]